MFNNNKVIKRHFWFCLSFLLSTNLFAVDYFVSENGSNSNSGTSESEPFLTIGKAMNLTSPGDTVYVMNGTYRNTGYGSGIDGSDLTNGNVVRITASGSEGAYITLRNLEGHKPKIQFDGAGGINLAPNTSYIIIEGFEVEGPSQFITYDQAIADRNYKISVAEDEDDSTNYGNNYFAGRGIYGYGPHSNVIVKNNIVHDTPGSGIRFNDSDYMTIEYNEVYNTTWWTSSASSAIVYAESIALDGDNGSEIKMIMRGNVVYNNWNRIPFYVTQLPDNAGGPGGDYGTASQDYILDGQGLYVTRSDPSYAGTFLFENNLLINNGKNGINFDHSKGASAIYRNNTLFFNGVHNIIQDLSVADGNPRHVGNNRVAGILANDVTSVIVANNIVVTRDSDYAALTFRNFSNKVVTNNIFRNGTTPDNFPPTVLNVDPKFVSVPETVDGPIDVSETDFSLRSDSPAINAGNPNYAATLDINKNLRPAVGDTISSSSFENSEDGWVGWSSTLSRSSDEYLSGAKSLKVSGRSFNYSSARLYLDGSLTVGETYSFSAWIKLADGGLGTTKATIRSQTGDDSPVYTDWTTSDRSDNTVVASDTEWTQISGEYTHETAVDSIFVYIKGPQASDGFFDYYIDDVYIIPKGSTPPSFGSDTDIVDLGAYEYIVVDADADGIEDSVDNCPTVSNSDQINTDNDTLGNACDDDDDGDGVIDSEDAFPLDSTETTDTDSDGIGNNADTDDDGDGVIDSEDAFPLDNTETTDTDSDGIGNNADTDDDGDGVIDSEDAFPLDNTETTDTDSDGVGDNSDAFPNNSAYTMDSDSDGMPDRWEIIYGLDPNDPSDASSDNDGDGISALQEFLNGTSPNQDGESTTLDIDGNNRYDALTDGLLVLRSMFGLTDDALIAGTVSGDAIFSSSADIQSRYLTMENSLDIDADGKVDALTDGLLILRYLFGLRGDTLIIGVVSPDATRSSSTDIEQYLLNLAPEI